MEERKKHSDKVESCEMLNSNEEITLPIKSENSKKLTHISRREICKCFSEYSGKTSIHGIQYLGETNRPLWERIFWIMVFIISIYSCSTMIFKLWRKWNDTPIIVSFDERQTDIWKIPFPSVTICPQSKMNTDLFSYERAMKGIKSGHNLTNEDKANKTVLMIVNSKKLTHISRREICKYFSEYSEKVSIHGIHEIIRLYIIVSFDERQTNISEIPFPSVTIYPQIKINTDLFSYERAMKEVKSGLNLTNEEIQNLKVLATVCDIMIYDDVPSYDGETLNIIETLYRLQEGTILQLGIQFQNIETETELSPILTEVGICYNFNGLSNKDMFTDECEVPNIGEEEKNSTDWHREDGYKKDSGRYAYPWRSFGSGIFLGFSIKMGHTKKVDNACSIPPNGFKVIIHSPDNVPIVSSKYFNVPANQQVIVAVQPSLMWTSDELRSYSPQKRQCFFSKEKRLKFFRVYTEVNCLMECRTQYTFFRCSCVSFYMPRSKDMNICEKDEDIQCSYEAQEEFLMSEVEPNRTKRYEIQKMKEQCNCLSPCSTIIYNAEISQNNLDLSKIVKAMGENDNFTQNWFDENEYTQLTIFYKENAFLSSKRSELYGVSEFMANCGGLFGLFMGISAISFIELFYFSIIRVVSNIIQARNIRN